VIVVLGILAAVVSILVSAGFRDLGYKAGLKDGYQNGWQMSKATTTTTLASSLNPSNFGQSVTFTASVASQFSGTVKGSVTFSDGTTALKTVTLSGGVAKFATSTLTSGAHNITATYNGNASFIGSSASLTQTVN
jgi:hypothetical protein